MTEFILVINYFNIKNHCYVIIEYQFIFQLINNYLEFNLNHFPTP